MDGRADILYIHKGKEPKKGGGYPLTAPHIIVSSKFLLRKFLGNLINSGQKVPNLFGALVDRCQMIRNVVLLAEGLHQRLNLGKVVARDSREAMVLDLEVQSTHEPVGQHVGIYVPAGYHLHCKEVHLHRLLVRDHGHPVVIQHEYQGQEVPTRHLRPQEEQ